MVLISNLFQTVLWIIRQNEKDIINLYNFLTPFVRLVTNSTMLNFGCWTEKITNPSQAQEELGTIVGKFAELYSAKTLVDIGSGFSGPAITWKKKYNFLDIVCININPQQLSDAARIASNNLVEDIKTNISSSTLTRNYNTSFTATKFKDMERGVISLVNATATTLPLMDHRIDRIIALESAQHFRPLTKFVRESQRILKSNGLLVLAIPVTGETRTKTGAITQALQQFRKLGLLSLTWASEHYELDVVKSIPTNEGFQIKDIQHIGPQVYEPLAEYYIQHRKLLKDIIMKQYHYSLAKDILYSLIETIIYKSALKVKELSRNGDIDYVLIKAK